ncbi:hypothetical protein OG749_38105 [Streptomyces nojiriensis]|uniref:hypothetical protein n=1 Tax=Streptomyces nojiriensis TaxID=66374 RepID=UPI002E1728F3
MNAGAIKRGRKGALTAYRDATLFRTIHGWGLRAAEAERGWPNAVAGNPAAACAAEVARRSDG